MQIRCLDGRPSSHRRETNYKGQFPISLSQKLFDVLVGQPFAGLYQICLGYTKFVWYGKQLILLK